MRVEKIVGRLHLARPRHQRAARGRRARAPRAIPTSTRRFDGHAAAWDELWEVCDLQPAARGARAVPAAPPHLARAPGLLAAHRPPRRRRPGPRPQRRGLPRPRLLGRAVRLSLPQLPAAARSRAGCSCTATGASARRAQRRAQPATRARCTRGRAAATARRRPRSSTSTRCRGSGSPDLSRNQRHVSAAIFYTVWHYHQATHDFDFLRDCGAEMMLEIARFWSSIAHFNPERDRWEIHGVMGPDEFHEKYPGAAEGGLRNNAYTNVMVAWICETAQKVLDLLPASRRDALRARIGLSDDEIRRWEEMSRRMFVPFHGDGIISQFEGYEDLEELDWDGLPREVREHPAARPDPARRGRRPQPLQAGQAGRHGDALLPLPRRASCGGCSSSSATTTRPTPPARRSTTTTGAPRTDPRSA